MIFTLSLFIGSIFIFLAALHFYWGLGGKWGGDGAIPSGAHGEKLFAPGIFACFVVGFILLSIAIFIAYKGQILTFSLPILLADYGLWVLAGAFMLRAIGEFRYVGFFKRVKNTKFARLDSLYYSPLCVLLALLMGALQLIAG
jgi:flagellar biosynthesis protein FliQ